MMYPPRKMLPGGWAWYVYEVLSPAISTLMTVDLRHNTARIKSRGTGQKDRIEVGPTFRTIIGNILEFTG